MNYKDELTKSKCMECKKELDTNDLTWISDNNGISWRKVCDNCYGDYLTDDELYGEDY